MIYNCEQSLIYHFEGWDTNGKKERSKKPKQTVRILMLVYSCALLPGRYC